MNEAERDRAKRGMRGAYDDAADRYVTYIAPTFTPIADRLLALAAPGSRERHVDLATGTGLIPARIERDAATGGSRREARPRLALDLSAAMLRRAQVASPTTHYVQGDLEALPLHADTVDVATLSLALHHLPDPRAALAEARRVLRASGRLAVAAWSSELSPLWRAFDAWSAQAGLGEARPVLPHHGALDTPARLRRAFAEVGFRTIDVTVERTSLAFPDLGAFWEWRASFPATHRAVGALSVVERRRHRASCLAALAPLVQSGPVRANHGVLFALAR